MEIPAPITYRQVARALSPTLRIAHPPPPHAPWIMFSLDVGDEALARRRADVLHLYLLSGFSFDIDGAGARHANHYKFFETSELDRLRELLGHLSNGMLHGSACGFDFQRVLPPELVACRTICLAIKPLSDAVYFAGVTTAQLLWFLRTHGWPERTAAFVEQRADDFAHLRWDVGLDFTSRDGKIVWTKTGLYGTY
jgi:hypothetical protein